MMNAFFDKYNKNPHEISFNEKNMMYIGKFKNHLILDLYDLLASICYHDFYTKRDENVNNKIKLNICVPVNNYDKINKILPDLLLLLKYMTNGEEWNINIKKEKINKIVDTGRIDLQQTKYKSVCLLSGGLDAFSGSILEKNNSTLYVTTETNDTEVCNSKKIYNDILNNNNNNHVIINKMTIDLPSQYTQRTRTLLFIANALVYADYFKVKEIKMYENGIMSLNPKFYFRRMVTKTTHPKTLYYINKILQELEINIKIINPFMYKTKGEVLSLIPAEYRKYISMTKTCSKNHGIEALSNRTPGQTHCGLCKACILRQISIINNDLKDYDASYMLPMKLNKFDSIAKLERKIVKLGKESKIDNYARYKYNEKKSLLEYYKRYYELIENKKVYNYLDLNPKYFEDADYLEKINRMLNKFKKELNIYFEEMEEKWK